MNPIARLKERGVLFEDLVESTRGDLDACIESNGRLLVSAMQPYNKPSITRLDVTHNVTLKEPGETQAVVPAINSARGALLHSMMQAHLFCEHGLTGISRCLKISIAVSTSPNFASLGEIQHDLRHFAKAIFDQENLPAASTRGVAALPGQALVAVTAEYEMAGHCLCYCHGHQFIRHR